MIRPEMLAAERERARCKRYRRDIFYARTVAGIETREAPLLRFARHIFVFAAADDIQCATHKGMPANFRAHIDRPLNFSGIVNLMDVSLIPLTKIKMLAVEAHVRPREVRAGKEFREALIWCIPINITIVI